MTGRDRRPGMPVAGTPTASDRTEGLPDSADRLIAAGGTAANLVAAVSTFLRRTGRLGLREEEAAIVDGNVESWITPVQCMEENL